MKQILRGETQELLEYLKLEMERLSEELRFEEAQVLKEKYQLVERYQSKSVIVSQTLDDIGVFGVDDDNTDVYVNYMHVRRGAIVRSITLQYKRRLEESIEQILSYAIVEAKEKFNLEYDEIIVPVLPDMEMPEFHLLYHSAVTNSSCFRCRPTMPDRTRSTP